MPPLLEPIAVSPTTVTTMVTDHLKDSFEYFRGAGYRGVFDEIMWYQFFRRRPQDKEIPDKPYQVVVSYFTEIFLTPSKF